jgi:PhnB protein
MAKIIVEPYLFFSGNTREAMEFYKGVFGGELTINTIGDLPEGTPTMPGSKPEDVVHASLRSGAIDLMATDSRTASPKAAKIELSLGGTDEQQMRKIFDALAEGGKVRMPLAKQFWGDIFGSLSDKYGIDWMMNIGTNAQPLQED